MLALLALPTVCVLAAVLFIYGYKIVSIAIALPGLEFVPYTLLLGLLMASPFLVWRATWKGAHPDADRNLVVLKATGAALLTGLGVLLFGITFASPLG